MNAKTQSTPTTGLLYTPLSKVLQYFILEKRGIIPRHSENEKILDIVKLVKRGILMTNVFPTGFISFCGFHWKCYAAYVE